MKRLLPTADLNTALLGLTVIDVGGDPHVDADELARVVGYLTAGGDPLDQLDTRNPLAGLERREGRGGLWPPENEAADVIEAAGLFAARAPEPVDDRPEGPCVGCRHAAHPGRPCGDPDGGAGGACDCDDYVDSIVRGASIIDPATGKAFPCICEHGYHVGQCTEYRGGHVENGQCQCFIYEPDRGPGPELPGQIILPGSMEVGFNPNRSARQAEPVE